MNDQLTSAEDSSTSPDSTGQANEATPNTENSAVKRSAGTSEPIDLDVQPKPSRAVILWILIIAIVLAILGYQMHGDKNPAYNVVVSINGDVTDYEIFIDGQTRGKFNATSKGEGDTHSAWLNVNDGKHRIEIKKSGAPFQSRDFEVKGKEYLRFDSGSTSQPN